MNPLLFVLVCFGLCAVGLCFLFLMPVVGKTLVILFSSFAGERVFSIAKNQPSGSDFIDPKELNGKHSID